MVAIEETQKPMLRLGNGRMPRKLPSRCFCCTLICDMVAELDVRPVEHKRASKACTLVQ